MRQSCRGKDDQEGCAATRVHGVQVQGADGVEAMQAVRSLLLSTYGLTEASHSFELGGDKKTKGAALVRPLSSFSPLCFSDRKSRSSKGRRFFWTSGAWRSLYTTIGNGKLACIPCSPSRECRLASRLRSGLAERASHAKTGSPAALTHARPICAISHSCNSFTQQEARPRCGQLRAFSQKRLLPRALAFAAPRGKLCTSSPAASRARIVQSGPHAGDLRVTSRRPCHCPASSHR